MDVINATTVLTGYKRNGLNEAGSTFQESGSEKVCEFRAALHLSLPVAWQKQNDYFGLCPGQPQKIQFTAQ